MCEKSETTIGNDRIKAEKLEILHEIGKYAFENQIANYRALDTKSSILLALFGLLLIEGTSNLCRGNPSFYVFITSVAASLSGLLISLFLIKPHKLKMPFDKLDQYQKLYESDMTGEKIKAQLFANIKETFKSNRSIINDKVVYLKITYYMLVFAVIVFSIAIIIKKFS